MRNSGVYLIRCTVTGLYKIGVAVDVQKRFVMLQVGSAPELELVTVIPGDGKRERELHRRFSPKHVRGEWFSLDPDEVAEFRSLEAPQVAPAEPPRVVGTLVPPPRGEQSWLVKIRCPYCSKTHTHGAGANGDNLGHRVAHCADPEVLKVNAPGYIITTGSGDPR